MIINPSICNSYGDIIWNDGEKDHQGLLSDFMEALNKEYGNDKIKIDSTLKEIKDKGIVPYKSTRLT